MNTTTSKSITTLIPDIYSLLKDKGILSEEGVSLLGANITSMLSRRLTEERSEHSELRMSNFGTTCDRRLWYSVNEPSEAESLPPYTRIKFLYGDIIEEIVLALAKEAGHSVEHQQAEVNLYGVKGHIDAIIDGVLIDVKSANARSFLKFKKPFEEVKDDIFFQAYDSQLQMYLEASKDLISVKGTAAFLAVDKEMGHMTLQTVRKETHDWEKRIKNRIALLEKVIPPARAFEDQADGASGNRKLGTYCSYCPYKKKCWPGVRTFIASTGPKYLTKVEREPSMVGLK